MQWRSRLICCATALPTNIIFKNMKIDGLSKQKLKQAIDYIQAHLGENLSLSAIAAELGMSLYLKVRRRLCIGGDRPMLNSGNANRYDFLSVIFDLAFSVV